MKKVSFRFLWIFVFIVIMLCGSTGIVCRIMQQCCLYYPVRVVASLDVKSGRTHYLYLRTRIKPEFLNRLFEIGIPVAENSLTETK